MAITLDDLRGDRRRVRTERLVARRAHGRRRHVDPDQRADRLLARPGDVDLRHPGRVGTVLSSDGWFPRRGEYDIWTLLVGSAIVTVDRHGGRRSRRPRRRRSTSPSTPARSVRKVLKPTLEILAGIPRVVLGFFAISVHLARGRAAVLRRRRPRSTCWPPASASASCPSRWWRRCRRTPCARVPQALREASYGMGARKITTIVRVVVPAAVSGLVAAFILAVSRAIGETMVVFIAGGAGGGTLFSLNPLEPGLTMTAAMAIAGRRHRPGAWARRSPSRASSSSAPCCSSSRSSSTSSPTASCAGCGRATRRPMALTTPAAIGPRPPSAPSRDQLTRGGDRLGRHDLPGRCCIAVARLQRRSCSSSCCSTCSSDRRAGAHRAASATS